MFQAFLPAARSLRPSGFAVEAGYEFEAVLRSQLEGPEQRLAALNAELARVGATGPAAVPLLIEASRCYGRKHEHVMRRRYAVQAYACAVEAGDPAGIVAASTAVAVASCWTGGHHAARSHVDRVAAYVDGIGDDELVGLLRPLVELAWVELQLQRLGSAEKHVRRGLRLADAGAADEHAAFCRLLLGITLCEQGRLTEAWRHAEHVRKLAELSGSATRRALALIVLGVIAMEAGDYGRTRELAGQAKETASGRGCDRIAGVLLGLGMIRTDLPREGRDLVVEEGGGRLLPLVPVSTRVKVYGGLAFADAALSHDREASGWAELAMRATWARGVERTRGYALLARAEAALRSDPCDASTAAESACAIFDGLDADLGRAAASLLLGTAQDRSGRRDEAERTLTGAQRLYRRAGAATAADRIGLTLDTMGEAASPAQATVPAGPIGCLSPREIEVAELIAEGRSNRQIGAMLEIKINTVQVHVGRILRKLGVRSRASVARLITLAESGDPALVNAAGSGN